LAVPGRPGVLGRFQQLTTGPYRRTGMAEVHAVTTMAGRLGEMDDQYGGPAVRPLAAAFLVNTIVAHLRASTREAVRKALLSAAADHLCMAVDERLDLLGRRYYTKALELAPATDDPLTDKTALRGTRVQALELGHGAAVLGREPKAIA